MPHDKRTQLQRDFDGAKHGWAFCNRSMLGGKIERLLPIARELAPDDPRHEELKLLQKTLDAMSV